MELQNQREVQEGIHGRLIIDAINFGVFLNDKIATEQPSRKKILIFHKDNNN